PGVAARSPACCVEGDATPRQLALGRTAAGFVGARRIEVRGRRLPFDCSGLTRAVYLLHGIDLYDGAETGDAANGVRLIYRHVAARGRIHRGPEIRPGDLVFFHNTWDRNGDGRVNDLLTHVGIVERVEPDGTVVFVSRVSRGIERYRMNLRAPHLHRGPGGRVLNDYMRRKWRGDPAGMRYLTGELFAAFGTLEEAAGGEAAAGLRD
ncbi:MAG TPA: NlpC/P60 family protein, partial [Thermodesulfobacteriota bacterium]|nr:NlpC/P60 family protein [Thermodesulfobacteriota bacterium]